MKPTQAQTLLRLKQRFTGTIAGAVFAAGLFCWPLPALLHAGTLGVMLTLMQLVGAKRYAIWTFCLTVIALDLKSVLPQQIGWRLGEERILLTIGGLALAILFSLRLPQSVRGCGTVTTRRGLISKITYSTHFKHDEKSCYWRREKGFPLPCPTTYRENRERSAT